MNVDGDPSNLNPRWLVTDANVDLRPDLEKMHPGESELFYTQLINVLTGKVDLSLDPPISDQNVPKSLIGSANKIPLAK
jgi:hypothetical protein